MTIPSPIKISAPAKLNLFLHILGKREDGYHNLQTVFQLLDFGDEIHLHNRRDNAVIVHPHLVDVDTENNLAYRAAMALRDYANDHTKGAMIVINKRLPMGGGIGGGSSDAASTLVGLNKLWELNLTKHQLLEISKQLGADVPLFVNGQSAWAEGIGDELKPIELPKRWYVVITPNCKVSTEAIFSHKNLTRGTLAITIRTFFEKGGKNDCQPLVETLYPQVKDAVDWLNQYGPAKMTGTGASVFAAFESEEQAINVLSKKPTHITAFVAKGVNQSPIFSYLP